MAGGRGDAFSVETAGAADRGAAVQLAVVLPALAADSMIRPCEV